MTTVVTLDDTIWEDVEAGMEAMLDEWHVSQGDAVTEGQCLATVMLVKSSHELIAPSSGVVSKLYLAEEAYFTQGQPLLEIA